MFSCNSNYLTVKDFKNKVIPIKSFMPTEAPVVTHKNTNNKKTLQLLFDADMVMFMCASVCETEIDWGEGFWTLHCEVNEVATMIDQRVQALTEKVLKKLKHKGKYNIIMAMTDDINFRKKIYPLYKANRIGKRKPVAYRGVVQWVKDNYSCVQIPTLEADDVLGILATTPNTNTVIISADKDFLSVPCKFYNMGKEELHDTTLEEADEFHLYQTLIGDTADNYKGCPKMGEVGAKKLFDSEGANWQVVVNAFVKQGLTEEDALVQARVARILRFGDYDEKKKEVVLWTPKA